MIRCTVDNRGDAVIVTFVLLMSIALSLSGSLLLDYGRIVGKEDEMAHSSDVQDSFLSLRTSMHALLESRDLNSVIVNRVTLGTFGNPYLGVARSSGTLEVDPSDEDLRISVGIRDTVLGTEYNLNTVSGIVQFRSDNYYFHDQVVTFQSGAVLLEEYGEFTLSSYPSIDVIHLVDAGGVGTWQLDAELFGITSQERYGSGFDTTTLLVSMDSHSTNSGVLGPNEELSFHVNGAGERAWASFFRDRFIGDGLSEGSDFLVLEPADWSDPAQELRVDILTIGSYEIDFGEMKVR